MNKDIKDGTQCQCSGTHKDHDPWVPETHKKVNNLESLIEFSYDCINFMSQHLRESSLLHEDNIEGLMQKKCNSSALAMELRLIYIKPFT